MTDSKPTLPAKPARGEDDARWYAWISRALDCDDPPIVAAVAYGSDDVEETAIVMKLADKDELVFRPARMIVSKRLVDVFAARGCEVPNYTAQQIRSIGSAIGRLARTTRDQAKQASNEVEFSTIGAEWIERCRLRAPIIPLAGRDGVQVRAVIERVRAHVAQADENATPPLIHDTGADELLVYRLTFRRYVRDRRGTTADDLLVFQMQRVGWERGRLAARPGPGQNKPSDLAVWVIPNGWQGIEVESPMATGDFDDFKQNRWGTFDPKHARAGARARGSYNNDPQRSTSPNGDETPE